MKTLLFRVYDIDRHRTLTINPLQITRVEGPGTLPARVYLSDGSMVTITLASWHALRRLAFDEIHVQSPPVAETAPVKPRRSRARVLGRSRSPARGR